MASLLGAGWKERLESSLPTNPVEVYEAFKKLLTLQLPYSKECCLFAFCLGAAIRVRPLKGYSWLHHLVLVFLTGFAGGIITPLFFGEPPAIFTNDAIVPMVCLSWYLIHHTGLERLISQFSLGITSIVFFFEIFRANSVMRTVNLAASKMAPSSWYPIPLFGPILVGTLSGSMGAFLPFDRGLSSIQNGVAQPIQVAFWGSAVYYLAAYDPYMAGDFLRSLPLGLGDPDTRQLMIVVFFLTMALSSTYMGPDFNLLNPLHEMLYRLTRVPLPPKTEERLRKQNGVATPKQQNGVSGSGLTSPRGMPAPVSKATYASDLLKVLAVALAVGVKTYLSMPKTALVVGDILPAGDYLTSCTWWAKYAKGCNPHYLQMETDGYMSLFRGNNPEDPASTKLWTSRLNKNPGKLPGDGFYATVAPDGVLSVKHRSCDCTFYATKSQQQQPGSYKVTVGEGNFGIGSDENSIWISSSK